MLAGADWPGNVRELDNVVSRAALRATAATGAAAASSSMEAGSRRMPLRIGVEFLDLGADARIAGVYADPGRTPLISGEEGPVAPSAGTRFDPGDRGPLRERVEEFQRRAITAAVERNGGNWAAAARDLGLHRSNLHHLAGRLGMRD
jgi:anaerobic nitric oxide reductase transcription regulator